MLSREWTSPKNKLIKHKDNRELVTARVNILNKKKVIRISIGLDVCECVNLRKNDRVNIYINKTNSNIALVKKTNEYDGYNLNYAKSGNFMTFDFRYETIDQFRLSQTMVLDYDFEDEILILDISKLKWSI